MEPQQCWHSLELVAYSLRPVNLLGPCKRTQHCWPTTPNNVGSCWHLLRPFAWALRPISQISYCQPEGPGFNVKPGRRLNFVSPSFATLSMDRRLRRLYGLLTLFRGYFKITSILSTLKTNKLNGHLMGFRQLVQKLGHCWFSRTQVNTCTLAVMSLCSSLCVVLQSWCSSSLQTYSLCKTKCLCTINTVLRSCRKFKRHHITPTGQYPYLIISHRRRCEYRRIVTEMKSR